MSFSDAEIAGAIARGKKAGFHPGKLQAIHTLQRNKDRAAKRAALAKGKTAAPAKGTRPTLPAHASPKAVAATHKQGRSTTGGTRVYRRDSASGKFSS
jgi:hypothetical protein